MMGIYNNYSYGFGNIGRTWAPKRQRLMVGRDVASIHKEAPREQTNGIILSDSVKLLEAALASSSQATDKTRLGFSLKADIKSSLQDTALRQEQLLAEGAGESVYLVNNNGKTMLRISGGEQETLIELKQGEDIRIGWDKEGKAQVFTGADALKGGKLVSQGENDILVRMSSADVAAGTGSTVLNLAGGSGGSFSGGHNVRYLGTYEKASIEGGSGTTSFEGYFGSSKITAEKGKGEFSGVFNGSAPGSFIKTGSFDDVFSGYFQLMDIKDAGGKNAFSGTFMSGSSIESGNGDDTFNGQFFDSKITDLGGNNTFGTYIDMKRQVKADFVRTVMESGDGNDKFVGTAEDSTINLGGGDDEVDGVLLSSTLNTGDGNDKLRLIYTTGSLIDLGKGDDELHLITGSGNSVRLGAGNDKMTSGMNVDGAAKYGTLSAFTKSAFLTEREVGDGVDPRFGHYFGDVQTTQIDASEGENHIAVHDGLNTHSVRSGEKQQEETPDGESGAYESSVLEEVDILSDSTRADMAMQNTLLNTMKGLLERTRNGEGGALSQSMKAKLEKNLEKLEKAREERLEEAGTDGERFLTSAIGGWLPNPGGNSVTIMGGGGESMSFDTMQRVNFNFSETEDSSPLRASLRKYRQFGGVNS